ncbi:hypothetical protein BC937DRAFT_92231 [Endogone sp. FLAS-F59071]|nr:hypothetical protein BC937DRAFT_92231 [Endogone sp. FLAS-F59071]|eukprot:RUS21573.1 hypothetical protein BC937DRAFT_92231 [Endogone sp. FLAS-F59071]
MNKLLGEYTENSFKKWSYLDFLQSNWPRILLLPPFSTDWTGLDGAWQSRFLTNAKEMPHWDHSKLKAKRIYSFLRVVRDLWQVVRNLLDGSLPTPKRAESGVTLFFSYHPLCGICGLFFDSLYRQLSDESDDVIFSSTVIAKVPDVSKVSFF